MVHRPGGAVPGSRDRPGADRDGLVDRLRRAGLPAGLHPRRDRHRSAGLGDGRPLVGPAPLVRLTPCTSLPAVAVTSARSPRLSQNLWVRLSVALAFADASIVVLALPQIVDRLHTSIGHSLWVIMGYNLALIVTSAVVVGVARRLPSTPTLIGGLIVFGLASVGCGLSNALSALIPFRTVQGVGGALILAASLPVFAGAARPGDSPLNGWSAAAAIGAAIGPAAGGILTQLFDWRSIFLTQAPVAAVT